MKKLNYLVGIILILFMIGCGKDKFQTKPTVSVKEIGPTDVTGPNGELKIKLECTDKEGDEGQGVLTYIRIRTNSTPIPQPGIYDKADTVQTPIPSFPKTQKVEMELTIPYGFLDEDPNKNDTMFFKITIRDSQNNQSDTITTSSIVAKQL
jgi:hypothetical protein